MFNGYLFKAILSLVIFVVGWIFARIIKRVILKISEKTLEPGVFTFLGSSASICIRLITIVFVLDQFGVNSNVIVGAFSACALGISMALKSNMADVAGGFQILLTKPFKVGEYVKIASYEGTVVQIELMYTVIQSVDLENTVIPNATMVGEILVNCTRQGIRRIHLTLPLSLEQDISEAQRILSSVFDELPSLLKEQSHEILVDEITSSSVILGIYCYCGCDDYWRASRELLAIINKKRIEANLSTPYDSLKVDQAE